jgi:integrase
MYLLYETGARADKLLGLDVGNLDWPTSEPWLQAKAAAAR